MSREPFKQNEQIGEDAGFEYQPSENESIHESEQLRQPDQVPEKQTPIKPGRGTFQPIQGVTQQSLVYSASSHDTEMIQSMNSPQFGVSISHPPKPNVLVSQNVPEQRINQMTQNLSNLSIQGSTKKQSQTDQLPLKNQNQNQPSEQLKYTPPEQLKYSGVYNLSQYQDQNLNKKRNINSPQQGKFTESQGFAQSNGFNQSNMQSNVISNMQSDQKVVITETSDKLRIKELEDQLQQEKLNSEQLRVYNHIIKFELERKLYNQGVFIVNDNRKCSGRQCSPNPRSSSQRKTRDQPIDIYLEIQHNRIQVKALEGEFRQKEQIIKSLEAQINQQGEVNELLRQRINELENQNLRLAETSKDAGLALQHAQQTLQQMESDKDALCGCIEEQETIIRNVKAQYENQRKQNEKLKDQIKNVHDQLNKSQLDLLQFEKEQKNDRLIQSQVDEDLMEKQRIIEEHSQQTKLINQQLIEKQKEIMQYQLQLSESQNKLIEFENLNRELSRQFNESAHQVGLLKKQNEEQVSQINILNDNLEQVTYEYESHITKTDRLERQVIESEKIAHDSLLQIKQKDEQIVQLKKKMKSFEKKEIKQKELFEKLQAQERELIEIRTQKDQEKMELETEIQDKAKEIADLLVQVSKNTQQSVEFKDKYIQINNERQQIIEELDKMQQTLNNLTEDNLRLSNELQDYRSIIEERENSAARLNALQIKYQADVEYFESIIKELQQRLENSQDTYFSPLEDKRIRELQSLYDKIESLLLTLNLDYPTQRPLYQFDTLLSSAHDLIDKLLQRQSCNSKSRDEDVFQDLRNEIQKKDKELQLYIKVIGSQQIQSLINEISEIENQLNKVIRQKKEIENLVHQQHNELSNIQNDSRDLTLRHRSQGLLKVSNLQDQLNSLQTKESFIKKQLNKLETDLERVHFQRKKQNSLSERYDYQNLNKQTLKSNTDFQIYDTFKPDSLSSFKQSSAQDFYQVPTEQSNYSKVQQNTIVKRKYFL